MSNVDMLRKVRVEFDLLTWRAIVEVLEDHHDWRKADPGWSKALANQLRNKLPTYPERER